MDAQSDNTHMVCC